MIRITLDDVAKQANVSTATVSRVITNSPLVNEKTKKKFKKLLMN
ncbi:LacI family DNA-binding transcriptional regulator [Sneathia sanguinegens]|uniref:LacI family DNA-binding transcriptional regulator n=1 Tax=Sneathia sanguinegens TaxID=40543 RepID=A0ABT7HJ03_9FUSO|nr:LacI family DNA-binding transcriptional regulator [Sneathia sanguinegens]MDK9580473.1 LacI family DNA-binding transcriptional regulator [Sneathia sanguinegens]